MEATKHLNFDFEVKKKSGHIVIEGMANAATVDRMKEQIDPAGWQLDNYKKNPVVLFDHGKDPAFGYTPIGKTVAVEPTEGGLYTKIQLSNSKTEKITAIRDLVEEGILKSFSVGFNPIESEKSADDPDIMVIKRAELIETSVVPIPMNQDSTFTVASKRLGNPTAKRWLDRYTERANICRKGAWVAAAVHQRFYDLMETGEITDRDAALKFIASEAGVTTGSLKDILAGDVTPVPPAVVESIAKVLRLDKDFLANLDKGDVALLERMMSRKEQLQEGKGMAAKKTKAAHEDEDKKKEDKDEHGQTMVVHQIAIPKSVAADADAAKALAEQHGFDTSKMEETEQAWVFLQNAPEGMDMTMAANVDMGDGVVAHVAPKAGAKSTEKAEEKPEESMKPEDEKPAEKEGDDQAKAAYQAFLKEREAAVSGGAGNPPSWVADEAKWEKAKEMAEAAGADDIYAFAVYAYLNVLGGGKKSVEAPATKNIEGTDDNPYILEARQTNVLLGTLIKETQGMSTKLDGIVDVSTKLAAIGSNGETPKDEASKRLDPLVAYKRDLNERLKRIGF